MIKFPDLTLEELQIIQAEMNKPAGLLPYVEKKPDYSGVILASLIGGVFFSCGLVTGAVMMYGLFNFMGG